MQRLTIFQVGDVHYPEHNAADADVKDGAFPASLIAATTSSQLQASTRELVGQLDDHPDAILVLSGDLTSRGDLSAYEECVDYLVEAFLLDDPDTWTQGRIHVVPGNHDVNRPLAAAQSPEDLHSKFEPLREAWAKHGLDVLAVNEPRRSHVTSDEARVELFGLNSCLGCGEQRLIPTEIQERVRDGLKDHGLSEPDIDDFMDSLVSSTTETIDAPALREADIDIVHTAIHQESPMGLPILIGHHNILQQALPRFDLYTDLVNAGMFRSRLASLGRPVLYLHGHIHSDAIEVIEQATPDRGQLVLISCPEFIDGFNRIELWFTDEGTAIGCLIRKFRRRLHGGVSQEGEPVRVAFLRPELTMSALARRVATIVLARPDIGLISEIQRELAGSTSVEEIVEAVQELEWLGMLEVLSADRPPRSWRLRMVATHA